jgi:dienelactone hydrolase
VSEDVAYTFDGRRFVGHLAVPDGDDQRPGVLVCHEGGGLDEHAKRRAERLAAELGLVGFALDYAGDGRPPLPGSDSLEQLRGLSQSPERIRQLGVAGLEVLLDQPRVDRSRVAAIGYCLGGTMALELARAGTDLVAVVGFHAGLATSRPAEAGVVRAKVLACIGADDPFVPVEQRAAFEAEMRAAGADWQLDLYGGAQHSFTNPAADQRSMAGLAYHEPTDLRSWQAMIRMFREVF